VEFEEFAYSPNIEAKEKGLNLEMKK